MDVASSLYNYRVSEGSHDGKLAVRGSLESLHPAALLAVTLNW